MEVAASSPDITLAALRLRKVARFIYDYDLNIPWRHEVRIEDRLEPEARKTYPVCTGGDGACPGFAVTGHTPWNSSGNSAGCGGTDSGRVSMPRQGSQVRQ